MKDEGFDVEKELKKARELERKHKEKLEADFMTAKNRKMLTKMAVSSLVFAWITYCIYSFAGHGSTHCKNKLNRFCKLSLDFCQIVGHSTCTRNIQQALCKQNQPKACFELGVLLSNKKEDYLKSKSAFLKACQLSQQYCHKALR